jgi:4-amino-4-deoxy-L-arabinose transferase-like glycosyltransferase
MNFRERLESYARRPTKDIRYKPWALCLAGLILAVFILLKAPFLSLPYFWDEIVIYAYPAMRLYEEGWHHLWPWSRMPAELFFGHPPAYASSLNLFFHIFGAKPITARAFTLLLACAGLAGAYGVGHRVRGPLAGLSAMILLASDPNYFTQSTQVLADVAIMCLMPALFYFAFSGRLVAYALCGAYIVLTKETALAVVVAIPLAKFLAERRASREEGIAFAAPVAVLTCFFLGEKFATGRFSNWPMVERNVVATFLEYTQNLWFHFHLGIGDRTERWIFLALLLAGWAHAAWLLLRRHAGMRDTARQRWPELAFVLSIVFLFLGKALLSEVNEHYFIPLLPPLILGGVISAWPLLSRIPLAPVLATASIAIWLQIPSHRVGAGGEVLGDPLEGKMNYVDAIRVKQQALAYVSERYGQRKVHAVWPFTGALEFPWAGYVSQSIELVGDPRETEVLVLAEASSPAGYEKQLALIAQEGLVLDREFEVNGQGIAIYVRGGRASSTRGKSTK